MQISGRLSEPESPLVGWETAGGYRGSWYEHSPVGMAVASSTQSQQQHVKQMTLAHLGTEESWIRDYIPLRIVQSLWIEMASKGEGKLGPQLCEDTQGGKEWEPRDMYVCLYSLGEYSVQRKNTLSSK